MNNGAHQTLFELSQGIRDAIQESFPSTVWVVAEISEMKENRSGHCYLELIEKDEITDDIRARARGTIWSYSWRMIRPYFESVTGQQFTQGLKVLVQVSVEYHPAYGLSLNIKDIDPTYTLGDLARRRNEILRQLQEAGVADMNRELSLPLVPQRIAVISSATAAGYQDFVNQLDNNPYHFRFTHELFEAYMQGSEAVPSILKALDQIFRREEEFDVVAIIRGGGSSVDLSCFDNFDLAFTVAQFPLPVVTGIGHEKDDTIVDFVAHTRLKTPTATAEFFITGALAFFQKITELEKEIGRKVRETLEAERERLQEIASAVSDITQERMHRLSLDLQKTGHRVIQGVTHLIYARRQRLQQTRHRLEVTLGKQRQRGFEELRRFTYQVRMATGMQIQKSAISLRQKESRISREVKGSLASGSLRIANLEEKLRILNPDNILKRGYTITSQNGKILKSSATADPSVPLETRFADGTISSKIIKTTTYGNE